jgi:hypothetical protein
MFTERTSGTRWRGSGSPTPRGGRGRPRRDFETLPPARAEDLLVEAPDPLSVPEEWLPPAVPEVLRAYARAEFAVGLPGDGGVVEWAERTVGALAD